MSLLSSLGALFGVVPVIVGPLQTLLALLPAILAALGGLLLALCKPSGMKKLVRFFWHQKIFSLCLIAVAVCIYTGFPLNLLPARAGGGSPSDGRGGTAATDWPAFHGGPSRSGIGPGDAEPTLATPIWTALPETTIFSSPAIAGDRVIVATAEGISPFSPEGRGAIVCLDAHSGQEIWRHAPDDFRATFSSPVVGEGHVVCGEGLHLVQDARVTCLDLSGRLVWELRTKSHVEATACIADGRVFIGAGDDGFYCVALKPNADGTPNVLWHLPGEKFPDCESSPLAAGGLVFFGLGEGGQAICAVDSATGQLKWKVPTPYPVFAPPTWDNGRLYVGMGNGNFVQSAEEVREAKLAEMRDAGASDTEIAAATERLKTAGEVWCLDAASGSVAWKFQLSDTVLSAIAAADGRLYFGGRDGFVYCVADDGQLVRRRDLHEPILSSVAASGQHLFTLTVHGRLHCLRRDDLEPVWDSSLGIGAGFLSSPAIAHGHVFVGTESAGLRCLGEPGEPQPPMWNSSIAGGAAGHEPLSDTAAIAWRFPAEVIDRQAHDDSFQVSAPLMALGDYVYAAGERGGRSQLAKLPTEVPAGAVRRAAWTANFNTPIKVAPGGVGDRLFVVEEPKSAGKARILYCLSNANDFRFYAIELGSGGSGEFTTNRRSVFIWQDTNELSGLLTDNGSQEWRQTVPGGRSVGSPATHEGLVFAATEKLLVALDDLTGTILWQQPVASPPQFGPVIAGQQLLLATAAGLELRRMTDGGLVWQLSIGPPDSTPVFRGGRVAVVAEDGRLFAFPLDQPPQPSDATVPHCDNGPIAPWLDDSRVIFLLGEELHAFDFATGETTVWCDLAGQGRLVAPLISIRGRGLIATERGAMLGLDAN